MDCHSWHAIIGHINLPAPSITEDVAHLLLLSKELHRLGRMVRDLLRLLTLVIVNVLFDRVVFGEHVKDLSLRRSLLYAVSIALLLHIHDLVALYVQHVLASLQCRLQLSLFLSSFPELPLCLVNQVLLQPYSIEFGVELAAISLESICPRAVISEDLGLLKRFILLLFSFNTSNFSGCLRILNRYFLARGRRWSVISLRLSFSSFSTDGCVAVH